MAALAVLCLYGALSFAFFGRVLIVNFTTAHLGHGVDATFLMWALVWWPYAIRHSLNPFLCKLVWAPGGFNLAWSGGLPLAALAAAPLTNASGPVAAYNVLCLIAPVAAAWSAFFLCRSVSGSYWPAILGGYIFGFSPYILGQLFGSHLNLLFVFPAPLIVLIAIHAFAQEPVRVSIVLMLAAVFIAQFLLSIELAATVAMFGGISILLAWFFADDQDRKRIRRLILLLGYAGGISAIVLTPYLYYLFQPGAPHNAVNSPGGYSADLANLIIPTSTVQFGSIRTFQMIAERFPGNVGERTAFMGLPLLFLVGHFGWKHWGDFTGRLLIAVSAIVVVCALGPRLRVAGRTGFGMPWKLATHVPMIRNALPGRFINYAFLAAAIIASRWLADGSIRRTVRLGMAGLIVFCVLPNLHGDDWVSAVKIPEFFRDRLDKQYPHPGETVVALPFGIAGDSMLWQAASAMSFRMAGGYTGLTPREFESWPVVRALMTNTYLPDMPGQLQAFMAAHNSTVVIVDDADRKFWASALTAIDSTPQHIGGIWLYRAKPASLIGYREISALEMERHDVEARFTAELTAAREYLAAGRDPAALTPLRAQHLGLLPPNWVNDPDVRTINGLYLGPWSAGEVAVGIVGSYDALRPLLAKYQGRAVKVFFPFPEELKGEPQGDTFMRLLVMVFDRAAL
jgi:hypothetical protein